MWSRGFVEPGHEKVGGGDAEEEKDGGVEPDIHSVLFSSMDAGAMSEGDSVLSVRERPTSLDQMIGNAAVLAALGAYTSYEEFPRVLLLSGPSGVGKSTAIFCLSRKFKKKFLRYPSSTKRSVSEMEEYFLPYLRQSEQYFLFLDEADGLATDSMSRLAHLVRSYKDHRFILACNYMEKISDRILSMATKLNFDLVPDIELAPYLRRMAQRLSIPLTEDGLRKILDGAKGDVRRAVDALDAPMDQQPSVASKWVDAFRANDPNLPKIQRDMTRDDMKAAYDLLETREEILFFLKMYRNPEVLYFNNV